MDLILYIQSHESAEKAYYFNSERTPTFLKVYQCDMCCVFSMVAPPQLLLFLINLTYCTS